MAATMPSIELGSEASVLACTGAGGGGGKGGCCGASAPVGAAVAAAVAADAKAVIFSKPFACAASTRSQRQPLAWEFGSGGPASP